MADPATIATPRSTSVTVSETHHHQLKAEKNKSCPFCGQNFTSSSLGRHLDLYIRPKNPKPSDGIHIVDEIRKIRGGITRRQTKTPIKRELGTPVSNSKQSVTGEACSPAIVQSPMEDDDDTPLEAKSRQSAVSWPPLGVEGGQPQRALGPKSAEVRRDVSRHIQKKELDQRQNASDGSETAKATEMALRELLKSVREANAKASGPGLFDFDPYTLNFPSMCLQILPPPSTLFSPTPFPTSESWSINPPGEKQLEALNRQVRERLLAHQRQRQIDQVYPFSTHSNESTESSPLPTPPLFDPDPQKLFCHIADAYNHWMHLSDKGRQEFWQVEILRSYARGNDLRQQAEINLANARREIEYLKTAKWSAGASEFSPISFSLGTETVKELGKHGMDYRNWDYDRLVEKWKRIVRETKDPSGMAVQKPLPHTIRSSSTTSLPTQFCAINCKAQGIRPDPMPFTAPPTATEQEPSSDQVDAEGEDDDGDSVLDADTALDEASLNNALQNHPHAPQPIHPSQLHAHIQAQVQAQAQAQAQAVQAQANAQAQAQAQAHAQAQAQAQMQAQVWAATRQHMNQSRNQHHHQQLSPHPSQHMGSAASSRRPSAVLIDTHGMSTSMNTGGMLPMEGIENHQDQFLRMGMGLTDGFVGSAGDGMLNS
ncbi:hypothetical protein K504DRAFT_498766 [Pleomassaria siparia CBS 279.74]|uniref:Uncharacterized protein n=1 Tax=Pleomassaria siparia CBS 279.74 TaxID=1314801 RepID=A0A6G1KNB7_9PLEO|nr:hypothetical protein K504DRAFT_498766 [Pleomassaria siparia CBS 279.74]